MKTITVAILALAMTSPFAFAHKHKGWGCHHHKEAAPWGHEDSKNSLFDRHIHCGNGSR